MKKLILLIGTMYLSACGSISSLYLPTHNGMSDEMIAKRRAEIHQMEMQDYQIARQKRQDAIEDLGTMQMNQGKAINQAHENISKQPIHIYR